MNGQVVQLAADDVEVQVQAMSMVPCAVRMTVPRAMAKGIFSSIARATGRA